MSLSKRDRNKRVVYYSYHQKYVTTRKEFVRDMKSALQGRIDRYQGLLDKMTTTDSFEVAIHVMEDVFECGVLDHHSSIAFDTEREEE